MKTSAALIVLKNDEVFLCHPTGRKNFDLPKGEIDLDETPSQTCVREFQEEVGHTVLEQDIIDLGVFPYIKNKKDLHIFVLKENAEKPNPEKCICTSYFELYGKQIHEVDGFGYYKISELEALFTKNMFNTFQSAMTKFQALNKRNFTN